MGNTPGVEKALEEIGHDGARSFFQAVVKRHHSASDHEPMNKASKKKRGKKKRGASEVELAARVAAALAGQNVKKKAWTFVLEGFELPPDVLCAFCDVLRADTAMAELSLVDVGLTEDSIDLLGPALGDNTGLVTVRVSRNPLGPVGVTALMEFLKDKASLRNVFIDETDARDEGAMAVAEAIGTRKNFKTISMANNGISEDGFAALLRAAKENIFVTDLRLGDNRGIDNERTKQIGNVFKRNEAVCFVMQKVLDTTFMQLNIRVRASQTNMVRMSPAAEAPVSRTREDGRFTRGRARGGTMDMSLVPSHLLSANSEEEEMEDCGDSPSLRYEVGATHTRGRRKDMQDAMLLQGNFRSRKDEDLFCVFDGHGSQDSAIFAAKQLPGVLKKHLDATGDDFVKSLRDTFHEVNEMLSSTAIYHGTTAAVALIVGDMLYAANVGDSRVVLCRNGGAVRLTVDHKPDLPGETERVTALGGTIQNNRVNGALAVTRAFGDAQFGELVSGDPYITVTKLNKTDTFLLVACDGLFDIFMDDVAVAIASGCATSKEAAVKLKDQAFISGSTDNISVAMIRFGDNHQREPEDGDAPEAVSGVFDPDASDSGPQQVEVADDDSGNDDAAEDDDDDDDEDDDFDEEEDADCDFAGDVGETEVKSVARLSKVLDKLSQEERKGEGKMAEEGKQTDELKKVDEGENEAPSKVEVKEATTGDKKTKSGDGKEKRSRSSSKKSSGERLKNSSETKSSSSKSKSKNKNSSSSKKEKAEKA